MNMTQVLGAVLIALLVAGGVYYYWYQLEPVVPVEVAEKELTKLPVETPNIQPNKNIIIPIHEMVEVTLVTYEGEIKLELDGSRAPVTVGNFVKLAEADFFDGTSFHRVISDFMIQGGDPLSRDPAQRARHGTGGPGYMFEDEFNTEPLTRGSLAMANSGPNTNGSQFFIVTAAATPWLDGKHTNFGQVADEESMAVVDAIEAVETDQRDNPITPIVVEDVLIAR
jgi:cyclophilin family peptidyl-prolyl cis-trans isomerase